MQIREVAFGSEDYKALLQIRHDVLRKPIGMELREKDIAQDHEEFHIAAFDSDKAIGCVLLRPIDTDNIRLRQMAVMDKYQGQGIGKKLVAFAEKTAAQKGYKTIETKARKTARGFYEKLGYIYLEDDEPFGGVVHVIIMHKKL